jgi:hypothetical protein
MKVFIPNIIGLYNITNNQIHMFFGKKPHLEEESITKKSVKKMDKVVTGMIL